MRARESNFRGFKSASGTTTPNSFSSALTISGRPKESRTPDSNRDSSGSAGMGFCATFFTTAKTRSWVVIQADFNMHQPVASLDVEKSSRIFVAGHRGLVGSAITRRLQHE